MNTLRLIALSAGVSAAGFSSASAATLFSDGGAFAAATTGVKTEAFDANIAGPNVFSPGTAITFAGGITSTGSNNQQRNEVQGGVFRGGTRAGRTDAFDNTITFDFGSEVTAFGGFFSNPNSSNPTISNIMLSGMFDGVASTFSLGSVRSDEGFIGLTSTTGFRTVTFSTDTGGFVPFGNQNVSLQSINFNLDDLVTGEALAMNTPSPVPLPASAFLLFGALGGLGALRKRRRAS